MRWEHQPFDYNLYMRYHSEDRETREKAVRQIVEMYTHYITFEEYIAQDSIWPYKIEGTSEILWTDSLDYALKHLKEIRGYTNPMRIRGICLGEHHCLKGVILPKNCRNDSEEMKVLKAIKLAIVEKVEPMLHQGKNITLLDGLITFPVKNFPDYVEIKGVIDSHPNTWMRVNKPCDYFYRSQKVCQVFAKVLEVLKQHFDSPKTVFMLLNKK